MKKEKSALGKIALFILAVYVLLNAIESVPAPFIVATRFGDTISTNSNYAICVFVKIFLDFYFLLISVVWFLYFWKAKESFKIPVLLTAVYYFLSFVDAVLNYLMLQIYDNLFEVFKNKWSILFAAISWTVLLIGTGLINRIIFVVMTIIRYLININFVLLNIKTYSSELISSGGFVDKLYDIYCLAVVVIPIAVMIFFMIWLIEQKPFYVSEVMDSK